MKKIRKTLSVLLAAVLLVSAVSVFVGAEEPSDVLAEKKEVAPFVLVHGLGGW